MGMVEDEDLGPLTRMHMERRASAKHEEGVSQPWDAAEVAFQFDSEKLITYRDCDQLLLKLPSSWRLKRIYKPAESTLRSTAVFEVRGPITIADGAHVRAWINLLK